MKILLIYNPTSGAGTFKYSIDTIIDVVQDRGLYLMPYRIRTREALDKMLEALDIDSFDRVWIAGGEGTIHHAINSLLKHEYRGPVGIYPVGTASDFARYFNFSDSVEEMTEILLRDNYTYCDLGVANGQYFLNVASLGFLIDISQKTDKRVKETLGVLAYYLKDAEELINLKPLRVSIRCEEFNRDEDVYFMLVMNGRSAGGFKNISPLASMSDGLLDVYLFKKCPVIELLPLIVRIASGEHAESPYVEYFQTAELIIDHDESAGTDLDVEKGFDFPVKFSVESRRLKLLVKE